ncbi:MAG: (d)CMP kinase [Candidatus Zixiibacteriota bacterium]
MTRKRRLTEIVIAIDGPAGAGKSTTAREVAKRLNLLFLDTGAMYRAITLKAIRAGIDLNDQPKIVDMTNNTALLFKIIDHEQHLFMDGEDVSVDIRRPEVTAGTTPISGHAEVRKILVKWQQDIGAHGGVVAEGRDTTSVVFPNAEVKIYMKADLEARASRRVRDLAKIGQTTTVAEQMELLAKRDHADSSRAASPLTKVADAREIDTSNLTFEEQVQKIIDLAHQVTTV